MKTGALLFLTFLLTCCSPYKWSKKSEIGQVYHNVYQHYFNDSLHLYICFYGGHNVHVKQPKAGKIPDAAKGIIKKETKNLTKPRLVFLSLPASQYFGYYYFGIITPPNPMEFESEVKRKNMEEVRTVNESRFFAMKGYETKKFWIRKYAVALQSNNFYLVCLKKRMQEDTDVISDIGSSILYSATYKEMKSMRINDHYIPYADMKGFAEDSAVSVMGDGTYLKSLHELEGLVEACGDPSTSVCGELLLTAYSFLNETDVVRTLISSNRKDAKRDTLPDREDQGSFGSDAGNAILTAARRNKILMFNESHYDWRHRYLITTLLDSLYALGYRNLAMEGIGYDEELNSRKYPLLSSGFYTREPHMANLVRVALQKGFSVIPYEDSSDVTVGNKNGVTFTSAIHKREYMQAYNLYSRYQERSGQKWIVLAGYGHINKDRFTDKETKSMAMFFDELSGITPYCIDQTRYCDLFAKDNIVAHRTKGYYYLVPDINKNDELLKRADLYIANNLHRQPYEDTTGTNSQYTFVQVEFPENETKFSEEEKLLMVYVEKELNENSDAIPIYIKRFHELETIEHPIYLPAGRYTMVVKNNKDSVLYTQKLSAGLLDSSY